MSPRDGADLEWPLSEGMQVSALPPVWIAMIISCWSVKLLKLPTVTFVAQTVTISQQKVCPESESLKFSTTPTPQIENPSDSDSSTPPPTPTPQPWLQQPSPASNQGPLHIGSYTKGNPYVGSLDRDIYSIKDFFFIWR